MIIIYKKNIQKKFHLIFIFCGTAVLISFNLKNWSNNFNPSYLQLIHNNMIHKNVSYFLTTVMNYSLLLPTLTLIHVMQLIQAPTTLTTNNCNCTTKKPSPYKYAILEINHLLRTALFWPLLHEKWLSVTNKLI